MPDISVNFNAQFTFLIDLSVESDYYFYCYYLLKKSGTGFNTFSLLLLFIFNNEKLDCNKDYYY